MGLQVILNIQSQDNAVFDLANMNTFLLAGGSAGYGGFAELYGEFSIGDRAYHSIDIYQGPFIVDDQGQVKIANREENYFADYNDYSEVWGCFSDDVAEDMAKYLISGRMVLRLDIEGNETEYFILEPGKMTKKLQSQLTI